MKAHAKHKLILSILIILFCSISCCSNDSSWEEMDYPQGRASSKSEFWDNWSTKEHIYYSDYRAKGLKYLYFRIKRGPLPADIQKLFIENLHNQVTLEMTNGYPENEPSDLFFSYESIYECVTNLDEWGIGVSRKRCSECLKKTILIYYISPERTWKSLAGRAGYMLICPHCLTQHSFYCTILS